MFFISESPNILLQVEWRETETLHDSLRILYCTVEQDQWAHGFTVLEGIYKWEAFCCICLGWKPEVFHADLVFNTVSSAPVSFLFENHCLLYRNRKRNRVLQGGRDFKRLYKSYSSLILMVLFDHQYVLLLRYIYLHVNFFLSTIFSLPVPVLMPFSNCVFTYLKVCCRAVGFPSSGPGLIWDVWCDQNWTSSWPIPALS